MFYGNKEHNSGGVRHNGDNLTGAGDGDDETISIDLGKIPAEISKIDFTVTIHEADKRKQNFGQVSNAYIRILNESTFEEILTEDYSIETAVIVAELYRNGAEWKVNAIGSGFAEGLRVLCGKFGVSV